MRDKDAAEPPDHSVEAFTLYGPSDRSSPDGGRFEPADLCRAPWEPLGDPSKKLATTPQATVQTVIRPSIDRVIRALAGDGGFSPIEIAADAIGTFPFAAPARAERAITPDICLRERATLLGGVPHLVGFVPAA